MIVGGGMVGASLAVALSALPLRIAVIEAFELRSRAQPSYDDRSTALAFGSRCILEGLGLWPFVAPEAEPIRRVHVSQRGYFGITRLSAAEEGVPALGYVVPNRALGAALASRLDELDNVELICPARVERVVTSSDLATLRISAGAESFDLHARLLVAADGAKSTVRQALGIGEAHHDYHQAAIVANVNTEHPHDGRAFERFTAEGPVAFLPLTEDRCAVVMTIAEARREELQDMPDADFLAYLQQRFGHRLGRLLRVGKRQTYPLRQTLAGAQHAQRAVIIGNAAHSLHPIAGQGFNLSLRDVAALADHLADAVRAGDDPGAAEILAAYVAERRRDQRRTIGFTHWLHEIFSPGLSALSHLRGLGLATVEVCPPLRRLLARRNMGRAGRLPRLARGLRP